MKNLLKDIFISSEPRLTKQPIHIFDDPRLELFFLGADLAASTQEQDWLDSSSSGRSINRQVNRSINQSIKDF